MKEKNKLLQNIDEAIKDKSIPPKYKKLLEKVRPELVKAKNRQEYLDVALKIVNIIGVLSKMFTGSG